MQIKKKKIFLDKINLNSLGLFDVDVIVIDEFVQTRGAIPPSLLFIASMALSDAMNVNTLHIHICIRTYVCIFKSSS